MTRSSYPEVPCTCSDGKPDALCAKHGVFADRWSGEFRIVVVDAPASEVERRERARRRRLKHTQR